VRLLTLLALTPHWLDSWYQSNWHLTCHILFHVAPRRTNIWYRSLDWPQWPLYHDQKWLVIRRRERWVRPVRNDWFYSRTAIWADHKGHEYTRSNIRTTQLKNAFFARRKTRSQAVARIADRTAKIVWVTWPRPRPLAGKFICAHARHCPYKSVYQIWSH